MNSPQDRFHKEVKGLGLTWHLAGGNAGLGTLTFPAGHAYYSRMRFICPDGSHIEVARGSKDGRRLLPFGHWLGAVEELDRQLALDYLNGEVLISERDQQSWKTINSSLDAFVSSVSLYEVWHPRLMAVEDETRLSSLSAAACEFFARLDPAISSSEDAWWPESIRLIGRLM